MAIELTKLTRLKAAIDDSHQKLTIFRENRLKMVKEYVGVHYSERSSGADDKVPVNMLAQTIKIYLRNLIARAPRAMVSTPHREFRPMAYELELSLNYLIKKIGLKRTIEKIISDAMFNVGIAKIGINYSQTVDMGGFAHNVGQIFVDHVSFDDLVIDMTARTYEEVQYVGNRYRIAVDDAYKCGLFKKDALDKMKPTPKSTRQSSGEDKVESVSRSYSDPDEYQDYYELVDLWLPWENKIITMPYDDSDWSDGNILMEKEYDGPETGPYLFLGFGDVPDNLLPISPLAMLFDMHDIINVIGRKLMRQAQKQKTIIGAAASAADDANRVVDSSDGDVIRLDHPDMIKDINFPGVDNVSLAFFIHLKDLYSWLAGNLDSLGGLSPMSDTIGQDAMLAQSASKLIEDMQDRVVEFLQSVLRNVAWFLWYDPLIVLPLIKRVQGLNVDISSQWAPDVRDGALLDYNIDIDPYSLQHTSPQMKLQSVMQVFSTFVAPYMQFIMMQGGMVNFAAMWDLMSRWMNIPELKDILMFPNGTDLPPVDPQAIQMMAIQSFLTSGSVGGGKPPVTTRNYVRTNRAGATRPGKDYALMQSLSGGAQPSEEAAISRPIS